MRILMLAQFYPPVVGGEERHVLSLSEALAARGHDVMVATMPHPQRPAHVVVRGVTIRSIPGALQRATPLFREQERPHAPPFPDPELTARLHLLIRDWKPHVVHAHNWLVHSFLPLRLRHRVGFVSTLHDCSLACAIKVMTRDGQHCEGPAPGRCLSCAGSHYGVMKGAVTAVAHAAFTRLHRRAADRFIVVSKAVAEWSGLAGGKIPYEVISTFIADDIGAPGAHEACAADDLPPDGYLLFIGDVSRSKGVHVLIDAYARLDNPPPLVLIGRRCADAPDRLPDNVRILGSRDHAAVLRAWSGCLFGLVPSVVRDACPTVVMEAAAMGKTVVASRNGGLRELIDDGVTGLLTPPGDAAALAVAMRALLVDPARRDRLARAALAKADSFRARSVVPKIEALYRAVASPEVAADGARHELEGDGLTASQ